MEASTWGHFAPPESLALAREAKILSRYCLCRKEERSSRARTRGKNGNYNSYTNYIPDSQAFSIRQNVVTVATTLTTTPIL